MDHTLDQQPQLVKPCNGHLGGDPIIDEKKNETFRARKEATSIQGRNHAFKTVHQSQREDKRSFTGDKEKHHEQKKAKETREGTKLDGVARIQGVTAKGNGT